MHIELPSPPTPYPHPTPLDKDSLIRWLPTTVVQRPELGTNPLATYGCSAAS